MYDGCDRDQSAKHKRWKLSAAGETVLDRDIDVVTIGAILVGRTLRSQRRSDNACLVLVRMGQLGVLARVQASSMTRGWKGEHEVNQR